MRSICLSLCLTIGLMIPALAQDAAVNPFVVSNDYEDIKQLLDSIQARIDKMNKRSSEADAALRFLDAKVREAVGRLSSRQDENVALRGEAAGLTNELGYLTNTREVLEAELSRLGDERDATLKLLNAANLELNDGAEKLLSRQAELGRVRLDLAALMEDRTKFEELAAVSKRDLDDVRAQNVRLSTEVTEERRRGADLEDELSRLRHLRQDLEAQLVSHADEIGLARRELEERDARLGRMEARTDAAERLVTDERTTALAAQSRVDELVAQLASLRLQLSSVNDQMAETEATNTRQQTAIIDLERQLNRALVAKVEELAKYRSEFFGKLREVLDQRDDIRVVGDRFVFQAEVLFSTGRAHIEPAGREQLKRFAKTLGEIAVTIPGDVEWVLRVDGHTDVRPIKTAVFPSNWELSTARATSVVKFLIDAGISAHRLAATGFGEYHPIDARADEIAYRRNRRIEFKLTQR